MTYSHGTPQHISSCMPFDRGAEDRGLEEKMAMALHPALCPIDHQSCEGFSAIEYQAYPPVVIVVLDAATRINGH